MDLENARHYEIDLTQGDLIIQLQSDDVSFIAQQMQRWYEILLDDTYVPVTIPPGEVMVPPAEALPEPSVASTSEPEPPQSSDTEALLLSQIKLLQEQVERLMVDKATTPAALPFSEPTQAVSSAISTASSPVDAFATPAHHEIIPPEAGPVSDISSGFEQPVENPSIPVQNPPPESLPETFVMQDASAFASESPAEGQPVENSLVAEAQDWSEVPVVEDAPAQNFQANNDLDNLLESLMTDLEQKTSVSQAKPVAVTEPPVPSESSFASVFNQAMADTPESPLEEEPSEGSPAETMSVSDLEAQLEEVFQPETTEFSTPAESPAQALPLEEASVVSEAPADVAEESMVAAPTKNEWDDLARLKPNEEFVVKSEPVVPPVVAEEEDLNPPFPTPEVAEKAEKGFGIAGPPPTDDPKIRKLSREMLESKDATMDDFISPFPKSQEELEREAAEAAQKAAEEEAAHQTAQAAANAGEQTSSAEADLFDAFGGDAKGGIKEDDLFSAFGGAGLNQPESSQPAVAAVEVHAVEHKGEMPKVEALTELCDMAPKATSGSDFMLLTAFFLKRFKSTEKFALKDINTQLLRSGLTPVNHALLETVIAQGLVELLPDLVGNAQAAEYTLTANGETYVDGLLNY